MKNIFCVYVGQIIEAAKAGDTERFEAYANHLARAVEEGGNAAGAARIRRALSGEKVGIARLQCHEPEEEFKEDFSPVGAIGNAMEKQ